MDDFCNTMTLTPFDGVIPKADVFMGKTLVLLQAIYSSARCPLFHGSIRLTGALFLGDANRYITGGIGVEQL